MMYVDENGKIKRMDIICVNDWNYIVPIQIAYMFDAQAREYIRLRCSKVIEWMDIESNIFFHKVEF